MLNAPLFIYFFPAPMPVADSLLGRPRPRPRLAPGRRLAGYRLSYLSALATGSRGPQVTLRAAASLRQARLPRAQPRHRSQPVPGSGLGQPHASARPAGRAWTDEHRRSRRCSASSREGRVQLEATPLASDDEQGAPRRSAEPSTRDVVRGSWLPPAPCAAASRAACWGRLTGQARDEPRDRVDEPAPARLSARRVWWLATS